MAPARTQPQRWRIELVEERGQPTALVRWLPPPSPPEVITPREEGPMVALLAALGRLARRGQGSAAWAQPLVEDPIAFLLDSVHDAVNVWSPTGELLFTNRSAGAFELGWPGGPRVEHITSGQRVYERRCLPFTLFDAHYLIEIIAPEGAPP
jgi:hypothetical protein